MARGLGRPCLPLGVPTTRPPPLLPQGMATSAKLLRIPRSPARPLLHGHLPAPACGQLWGPCPPSRPGSGLCSLGTETLTPAGAPLPALRPRGLPASGAPRAPCPCAGGSLSGVFPAGSLGVKGAIFSLRNPRIPSSVFCPGAGFGRKMSACLTTLRGTGDEGDPGEPPLGTGPGGGAPCLSTQQRPGEPHRKSVTSQPQGTGQARGPGVPGGAPSCHHSLSGGGLGCWDGLCDGSSSVRTQTRPWEAETPVPG